VTTRVRFMTLSDALLADYLETDEPWDKAGAYAIQGLAGSFVEGIEGSVSNVIGLPLVETRRLLARAGVSAGVGRETA
jgi:septum formation protein